jgi:hypothetical protein
MVRLRASTRMRVNTEYLNITVIPFKLVEYSKTLQAHVSLVLQELEKNALLLMDIPARKRVKTSGYYFLFEMDV